MAAPSHAIVGTRLSDADSLTGWDTGNINTDDNPIQGTGAIGQKLSGAVGGFHYTHGTTFNLASPDARHFYVWLNALSKVASLANGGLRARVGNDASNYADHYVAGNLEKYVGGFRKFAVSPRRTPEATVGAPDLTLADYFGGAFSVAVSIMGNFNNVLVDAIDLLEAVRVTDGDATTPGTFADLQVWDTGTTANQYGIISKAAAGVFFVQGRVYIGDGATTTLFDDAEGTVVVFEDALVDADFFEIRLHANATLTLGELVSGAALNGATILSAGPEWYLNLASGTANLYGCAFGGCRLVALSANATAINCAFSGCGTITPAGATITGGSVSSSTDVVAMTVASPADMANVSGVSFLGNDRAIEITGIGTYTFDALRFSGNAFGVRNNSGGAVTINVINGGDGPSVENIGGSTTTVNNTVTVRVTVKRADTGAAIANARVYLVADTGGPLPVDTEILNGLTDASGVIQDTGFNFQSAQPVVGHVRKASASPYFKEGPISGTISSGGFDTEVLMVLDE